MSNQANILGKPQEKAEFLPGFNPLVFLYLVKEGMLAE